MYLIVGLGNPGDEYKRTRHNAGFLALDHLISFYDRPDEKFEKKRNVLLTSGKIRGSDEKCIIIKPLSFMNRSGSSVQQVAEYYKIAMEKVIVLHDEIDLAFGAVKDKEGGGHAGHNGLRDIIAKTGTKDFQRIRIGVDRPSNQQDVSNYVLSNFSQREESELTEIFSIVQEKVEERITKKEKEQK